MISTVLGPDKFDSTTNLPHDSVIGLLARVVDSIRTVALHRRASRPAAPASCARTGVVDVGHRNPFTRPSAEKFNYIEPEQPENRSRNPNASMWFTDTWVELGGQRQHNLRRRLFPGRLVMQSKLSRHRNTSSASLGADSSTHAHHAPVSKRFPTASRPKSASRRQTSVHRLPARRSRGRVKNYLFLAILVLASGFSVQSTNAETLLEKVADVTSPTTDASFKRFYLNLLGTFIDQGEPVPLSRMNIETFSLPDQVHFYFLARMATLGWLRPLLRDRDPYSCDALQLRLQSVFVSGFQDPAWCDQLQWDAAHWLLSQLNDRHLTSKPNLVAKLFLLMHTVGIDLSPLEVRSAIEGTNQFPPPGKIVVERTPYLSQHIHNPIDTTSPYESWNPWTQTLNHELLRRPLVYFWHQRLHNNRRFLSRIDDIRGGSIYADIYEGKTAQYYIGQRLTVEGTFGLRTSPSTDTPDNTYSGFKLLVNELHLDRTMSPLSFGEINMTDIVEPPILNFSVKSRAVNNNPIILARTITLGSQILEAPLRMWSWVSKSLDLPTAYRCPISARHLAFSLKQISPTNPYVSLYNMAIDKSNCIPLLLQEWRNILSFEIDRNPQHILHRYVSIATPGGMYRDGAGFVAQIFAGYLKEKVADQIYVRPSTEPAVAQFSQEALEQWGVAADAYLNGELIGAGASGDKGAVGRIVRERLLLRRKPFTKMSSKSVSYWTTNNESLQRQSESLRMVYRVEDVDRWGSRFGSTYAKLIGTEGTLDLWNVPDAIRILEMQNTRTSPPTFFHLWKERLRDSDEKLYVGFAAKAETSSSILPYLKEAIERKGFLYSGILPDATVMELRPRGSTVFRHESVVPKKGNAMMVLLSTDFATVSSLIESLVSEGGMNVTVSWSMDPMMNEDIRLEQPGSIGILSGGSRGCGIDDCVVVHSDGFQLTELTFVNHAGSSEEKGAVEAVVNFDIEGSDGELLYAGLLVRLGWEKKGTHRRNVRLMLPEEFRLVYRVRWVRGNGSDWIDAERISEGRRVYIR